MAEKSTWIKIDRNIQDWRWYQDGPTFRLWIHLLLNANVEDKEWCGITVHRGELATSVKHLSEQTGLTIKQVRRALDNLVASGEVGKVRASRFTLVQCVSYDVYQQAGKTKGNNIRSIYIYNNKRDIGNIKVTNFNCISTNTDYDKYAEDKR